MIARKMAVGFGLALLFPMLIYYGVTVFVPEPKWEDYTIKHFNERRLHASGEARMKLDEQREAMDAKRKEAEQHFARVMFWVSVPLGVAAVLTGAVVSVPEVAAGLSFGGVFAILMGYTWYWTGLSDGVRFLSLLLVFVVLIALGYRRLGRA